MYPESMCVYVNGKELELFTISKLAKAIKRSPETIRVWEKDEITPKALFRKNNIRLYHPLEVEAMKKVTKKMGRRSSNKEELRDEMWKALTKARMQIKELIYGKS